MVTQPEFLKKPMSEMTDSEWESICDGCGLCCQHRAYHPVTGEDVRTNAACRGLNLETLRCDVYANRLEEVEHCFDLRPENLHEVTWLPATCGYRLVAEGQPLFDWHHLICGDRQAVHARGPSKSGQLIADKEVYQWIAKGCQKEIKPAVRFYDLESGEEK